jgi:hypothetical protein
MIKVKIKTNKKLKEQIQVPKQMFHGSPYEFKNFDSLKSVYRGLTFFSNDKEISGAFAGGKDKDTGFLYTVTFNNINIFDSSINENLVLLKPIIEKLVSTKYKDPITGMNYNPSNLKADEEKINYVLNELRKKSWKILENEDVLKIIKEKKFDGINTSEAGALNIGLFSEALSKVNIIKKEVIQVLRENN